MSVKIKVSYESPHELQKVLERLGSMVQKYKTSKEYKGQFKKAYIVLKEASENN